LLKYLPNMIRKKKSKKLNGDVIRLRGHEVSRMETFSDGVFAFALTLLVVSLEVPKSFTELKEIIRGFPAFFIGALFLFMIWNEQNEFFRSYGMKDKTSINLNAVLLFVVLFYVYPIKFLFSVIFSHNKYVVNGETHFRIETVHQNEQLLLIYAAGFIMVYITFACMYAHALRRKQDIELNEIEIFQTKSNLYSRLLMICIGIFSALLTVMGGENLHVYAGLSYTLIWPVLMLFFSYRNKRMKKIFGEEEIIAHAELISQ
jgi:uncharacterized membrane protein